jgi:ribbon-helix-helix CopG family protein
MRKQARRGARSGPTTRGNQNPTSSLPTVQYTVRSVPANVDKALRRKADKEGKSLNEVLRDALIREAEGTGLPERVYTDLDDLAGSWVDVPGFDEAIQAQDRVDETLWR